MNANLNKTLSFILLIVIAFFINYCQHEAPMQSNAPPCIGNQPVEDTTRVYLWPISRDTLRIYPPMIFARFYPWVQDTTQIKQLLDKHRLRLWRGRFDGIDQQLSAWLCVTDGRRAEYHFTPYGKEGYCNFGADSLVEYSFGVFNDGSMTPTGNIDFRIIDGTPQARIDSLFDANGLRFMYTVPDIPSGKWYRTLVTHRSEKNVLDLAYELRSVHFVRFVDFGFFTGGRVTCD